MYHYLAPSSSDLNEGIIFATPEELLSFESCPLLGNENASIWGVLVRRSPISYAACVGGAGRTGSHGSALTFVKPYQADLSQSHVFSWVEDCG